MRVATVVHPRSVRLPSTIALLMLSVLLASSACHRSKDTIGTRPASREGASFVGIVSDIRSLRILAQEESALLKRSAAIWVSPSTEIVNRQGFMIPLETVHRGMRVIVWFTAEVNETETTIEGRASRIVVE